MEDLFDTIHAMIGISRYSKSEVVTPQWVVSDMVDLLPADVFLPESKFLDPAVKSGRFLVELYNRLMASDAMKQAFPNERARHEHILHNQLYGIAMSETAAIIARKQLYDNFTIAGNIICTDGRFTKELVQGAFSTMKFDVVIGNPPYNNDMYLDFVTLGCQLSTKYTVMIIPAKWQAKTDGKPKNSKNPTPDKNEEFRKNIVPYMSKIVFYPNTRDIFDISEGGGISYFVIDKHIHNEKDVKTICKKSSIMRSEFEPHDETNVTLYNHKILSIIGKVGTLGEGFKQSLYVKNTDYGEITIDGTLGFKRQTFIGEQDRGELLKQAEYAEVVQGEKVVGYKAIKDLFTTAGLGKYKCITSIIISGGGGEAYDNDGKFSRYFNCYVIKPNQVPKGSFPVIKYFDNQSESDKFVKYTQTKLFQFLFVLGVCGTTLTKEFFRFIPDPQDWTLIYEDAPLPGYTPDENGIYTDNDGNKHCSLYKKYNLTQEEINIIESVIKDRK